MINDEIKEKKTKRLIEKIKGLTTYVAKPKELSIYNYLTIDSEEAKLLIDYITNLQQKLQRKDNIINELEKCMEDLLNEANDKTSDLFIYEQNKAIINMFLDKINELEGDNM